MERVNGMKKIDPIVALTTITTLNVANASLFDNNKFINIAIIGLCVALLIQQLKKRR